MRPISIDIVTAGKADLRLECNRLGVRVSETADPPQLRLALRRYNRRYQAWKHERDKWCEHARLLDLTVPEDATPEQAMTIVCDHLWQLLVDAGYIGTDARGRRKRLIHPSDDCPFYITGRLEGEWVSTACPTTCKGEKHELHGDRCAVWFAVGCAFPNMEWVNFSMLEWETGERSSGGGS
jgi:hypothetical protein